MTIDINKLNELYDRMVEDCNADTFHDETTDAWPSLYKELIAGRKLREGLGSYEDDESPMFVRSAIAEYDNALKE